MLAYEERIIARPQGLKEEQGGPDQSRRRVRTAVLAVPEKETTRVMLGASLGEVRLSLRPQQTAEALAAAAAAEATAHPLAPVTEWVQENKEN